jgi:hypothetical protein
MAGVKYCGNCKRWVTPEKHFSWAIFILGSLFTLGIAGVIYLLYYLIAARGVCPICNSRNWTIAPKEEKEEAPK